MIIWTKSNKKWESYKLFKTLAITIEYLQNSNQMLLMPWSTDKPGERT